MSDLKAVFSESIDDVLQVVKETPRGRWFLDAYAERLKRDDTKSILASIAKLEDNLKSMSVSGSDTKLVEQTRAAISKARRDIQAIVPDTENLSAEGQLFAKLAEQSRHAFSIDQSSGPAVGKGVERALRLVADLEKDFAVVTNQTVAVPAPSRSYFKQDESIFEPAPSKPAALTVTPQNAGQLPEQPARGARLVIHRLGEPVQDKTQTTERAEPPILESAVEKPAIEADEKPRITIIRRSAEEMTEVPLPTPHSVESSISAA